ncbi:hypothetical protein Cadr_000026337 [Camelus dromedarius]|uniref:Uncharacterized protein n=1 Tax=Camelus dromedarius TaxID=9838 RepID=A0A5N4CEI9_CAMDR|nr:hypothetical protein Cadr_000026337 [Camelus dromedarius]
MRPLVSIFLLLLLCSLPSDCHRARFSVPAQDMFTEQMNKPGPDILVRRGILGPARSMLGVQDPLPHFPSRV